MIVALLLAYGAAVTSLGLALATWLHRLDFAVATNVAVLGGVTVGWFLAVVLIVPRTQGTRTSRWQPDRRHHIPDDGDEVLVRPRVGRRRGVMERLDQCLRGHRGGFWHGSPC